jgi:threonine dehydratase
VTLDPPVLADILAARRRIRPYLDPSPLRNYPALDRLVGAQVWVKHENLLPTGAFKVRGGVNLMSRLDSETRARGVIAASTGNHGQSVAFAAKLFGVSAIICAPEGANPVKVEAMRDFGAEVVLVGSDFDDARLHCERLAADHGYRYIHSGNEPDLVAGVATHTLEILEEQPDIEVILVPVGGGSGAAAACIAAKAIRFGIEVIAVQSTAASTAHDSWRARTPVERPNTTIAEGLATRTAFELPQRILRDGRRAAVRHRGDDRENPHPCRARRRGAACRGSIAGGARPVGRAEGSPYLHRRKHQSGAAAIGGHGLAR